nr:hypothetical protein [Lachnospiraceae bacterium]
MKSIKKLMNSMVILGLVTVAGFAVSPIEARAEVDAIYYESEISEEDALKAYEEECARYFAEEAAKYSSSEQSSTPSSSQTSSSTSNSSTASSTPKYTEAEIEAAWV